MDLRELPDDGEVVTRHPWHRARVAFFEHYLRERGVPVRRWLDVGSGDGWTATSLHARLFPEAELTCWDIHYTDEYLARQAWADGRRIIATRDTPKGHFDLVTAFDVLEHVEDDREMLRFVREHLAPDGQLFVSVPAWPQLFGEHDKFLHHVRRYQPREAEARLEEAGFAIHTSGGLFHALLGIRALERVAQFALPGGLNASRGAEWGAPRWFTRVVDGALAVDTRISRGLAARGLSVPGLSYFALCTAR
ncbi:MAG: class I SAM-dependent methyltransferase [Sandaracinaceae bacterium]